MNEYILTIRVRTDADVSYFEGNDWLNFMGLPSASMRVLEVTPSARLASTEAVRVGTPRDATGIGRAPYFIDNYDEDGKWYVFNDAANGNEAAGPFDSPDAAQVEANALNTRHFDGLNWVHR